MYLLCSCVVLQNTCWNWSEWV